MVTAKTMGESPSNGRPPSKGRQRIVIESIKDKGKRQVTESKRKSGFFKKASEAALLCGAHVAAIIFSQAGKVSAFGSPSVDSVLRRLAPLPAGVDEPYLDDDEMERAAVEAKLRQVEETRALVAKEEARMAAVGKKVLQAVPADKQWWEADVGQLGEAELPEFNRALLKLRDNVKRHADKLRSDAPPTPLPLRLKAGVI
ncbi:hypothetical protein QOZ80_6BG0484300 [Eleusine coracana subsp. coracana]|nr:hypothetical protein QOZ80_6BG0484300 [Eleusine coracana subsp. coracana]